MTAGDTAEMQELSRQMQCDPEPETAARSAEGRSVPFAKGTRTPGAPRRRCRRGPLAKACTLQVATLGAPPPRLCEGKQNPPCEGGNTTATRGADRRRG